MPNNVHRVQFTQQSGTPPIILHLLIANIAMFVLQLISNGRMIGDQRGLVEQWLLLYPLGYNLFHPWQLVTYGFLHGSPMHLIFNMFVLWMFGKVVAQDLGERRFLIYYLACVIGAGLCHLLVQTLPGIAPAPILGASGGTMGVLLAFGWRFPQVRVMLMFPPIPMKARTLVILLVAMDLFMGVGRVNSGIAHFAHLGGLATGSIFLAYWCGILPIKPKRVLPFR